MRTLLAGLALILLLPLATAQAPIYVASGETLVVDAPCGGTAELISAVAIVIEGTVRIKQYDCSGPNIAQAVAGTAVLIQAPIITLDGGTISSLNGTPAANRNTQDQRFSGQSGGNGGNITISGTDINLAGTIILGSGADGGHLDLRVASSAVLAVVAGHGGNGGSLVGGDFDLSEVTLLGGHGGRGGDLRVTALTVGAHGSDGVSVTGTGGQGGSSGNASRAMAPAFGSGGRGGDALAVAGDAKDGGRPTAANESVAADGGRGGQAQAFGGHGGQPNGPGGNATALGGHGGQGIAVVVDPCIPQPFEAGNGGSGGAATATGGLDPGIHLPRPGSATARGGDAGHGGDSTGRGGTGGDGGDGGLATAVGDSPAPATVGAGGNAGLGRSQSGLPGTGTPPGSVQAMLGAIRCTADAPTDPYAPGDHIADLDAPKSTPSPLAILPILAAVAVCGRRRS